MWALIYANESYLLAGPKRGHNVPALYDSGVRWEAERPQGRTACPEGDGQELFLGIRQVLAQGFADCEDVASWRAAELRMGTVPPVKGPPPFPGHPPVTAFCAPFGGTRPKGPDCYPAFFQRVTGPGQVTIHIVVAWPDGFVEDPSRKLGMGGARRYG